MARDLARVLGATQRRNGYLEGNGLRVTWCFGHMCELEEPGHYDAAWKRWSLDALPMLPSPFALRVRKGAHEQFAILRRLITENDVTGLVNACDAGREGELIFRYVVQMIGSNKPVERLWVSSLTDVAIKTGWRKLRPGMEFDNLADAARSRSEADWLVGLNATRALTCASRDAGGGALLSLGRVQTPTVAMIVGRDALVDAFVPEAFWRVQGTFFAEHLADDPKSWKAWWFRGADKEPRKKKDDDDAPNAERLSEEDAAAVRKAVTEQPARVVKAERKRVVERPPLLY
ncbi:MAG: hypothetical protein GWP91_06390, partial [Rhodobacterales bacterium]|nr:hypothetical protein [Rhodobacterales bacterium]